MNKSELLEFVNSLTKNTLMQTLGIVYHDVGEDYLCAMMPVRPLVYQPDGVLHGGATVALAESVGSAAAYLFLNTNEMIVRGIEIAANHIRSVKDGNVYAKASLLHKGQTTQLWQISVTNDKEELISMVKLTTIALPKKSDPKRYGDSGAT